MEHGLTVSKISMSYIVSVVFIRSTPVYQNTRKSHCKHADEGSSHRTIDSSGMSHPSHARGELGDEQMGVIVYAGHGTYEIPKHGIRTVVGTIDTIDYDNVQ